MTSLYRERRGFEEHISYIESIRRCHAAGFRVLDFNACALSHRQTTLHLPDWKQQADAIRNEAEKLGMVFSQSHPPYRPGREGTFPTQEEEDFFRAMSLRSIEISAMLGVKWAVLHPVTAAAEGGYNLEKNLAINRETFSGEIELGGKLGVGLAFENMCDPLQRRRLRPAASEIEALMDYFNLPHVGLCWDVGHGYRMCPDQVPSIMRLGNRIKALHIDDNIGQTDLHQLPFMGDIPWEDVMHALYASGCKADLIYEVRINRNMPDALKDITARYSYQVGEYLLSLYK